MVVSNLQVTQFVQVAGLQPMHSSHRNTSYLKVGSMGGFSRWLPFRWIVSSWVGECSSLGARLGGDVVVGPFGHPQSGWTMLTWACRWLRAPIGALYPQVGAGHRTHVGCTMVGVIKFDRQPGGVSLAARWRFFGSWVVFLRQLGGVSSELDSVSSAAG